MAIGLEIRIKRLEAKVQELNEREAIRDLRYRYHEYVNEGKFTRIAGLFTVNGELAFGLLGHAKGRAQISAFFRGLGPESSRAAQPSRPRLTRVRQFIHNHMIEIDGDRAGVMGFEVANRRSGVAQLGGLAVHPDFRGRHVADDAARLLQRHLIFELGYHRLQLEIYGFNERAMRHAERAGFVKEGVKRNAYRRHDDWVDGVLYGLIREDLAER